MRNLIITDKIDYFVASMNLAPHAALTNSEGFGITRQISPLPHYDKRYELECGGFLSISHNEKQGNLIELGGTALEYMRNLSATTIGDVMILNKLSSITNLRNVTRLDYCIDCHGFGSMKHIINHARRNRHVKTTKARDELYGGMQGTEGSTAYFGGRKSTQYVRVYDKAYELKLLAQAITRIELQTRTPHSKAFWKDINNHTLAEAGKARIERVVSFPLLAWWNKALSGERAQLSTIGRKKTNWQNWLNNQVEQSFKSDKRTKEDIEFALDWLWRMYNEVGGNYS